jgi:aryl-alcohol dehydrogenase-like predicted oxidoreductase
MIKTISDKHNKTCSQVSIKWLLSNRGVTSAIVGMKNIEQVNDIMGAIGWSFTQHEKTQLDELTMPFIDSNLF